MSKEIFRWVQLSDIHFQVETETFNDALIRSNLPDYLKSLNLKCDLVIFSGDFRFAPKKEQTNADQVIEYIHGISSILRIDDDHVVMVPGNHDLNRSKSRDNQINGTRSDYNPDNGLIDSGVLTQLTRDFDFYSSVQKPFKNSLKINEANPHGIIELGNCYLLLLNTALVAGKDDEAHQLILGSKYLNSILDKKFESKPIVAIGHHGLSLLEAKEKDEITRYFDDKGVRLYLCGHEHKNGISSFGEKGRQVNVGCMKQGTDDVIAGFSVGTLFDNGDVDIVMHKWDKDGKIWTDDKRNSKKIDNLYPDFSGILASHKKDETKVDMIQFPFVLKGFQLLGDRGCDGIKYYWEKEHGKIVESIAFNRRTKFPVTADDNNISAYTISSSIGCQLSANNKQCIFCQTGANKYSYLSADDMALQCIFMAEYDADCPSYPEVRTHPREFAFMGQGEPGLCYDAVKRAILLNDYAMNKIGQKVSRYIISTCGITDFIPSLTNDFINGVYKNKVTLHFSLNAIDAERDIIMPVNQQYNYQEVIDKCKLLFEQTNEKIGVSILLMVDYQTTGGQYVSLDTNKLKAILDKLDPAVFKIDFCTVNKTTLGTQRQLSNEDSNKYLQIAKDMGFECKLFASIGDSTQVGCGILTSTMEDINEPGNTTRRHYNNAVELLKEAKQHI